jgi:hypothetical protein
MTNKEKKTKAAAIAVSAYVLLTSLKAKKAKKANWRKVSLAMRMQRRGLLRFSGRIPSNYRLRM